MQSYALISDNSPSSDPLLARRRAVIDLIDQTDQTDQTDRTDQTEIDRSSSSEAAIDRINQTDRSSAPPSLSALRSSEKPYAWVLSPAIDLLLCCGGLCWILFFGYQWFGAPNPDSGAAQMFTLLAILGIHILNESHTAATLVRVYGTEESRQTFHTYTVWWALACVALAISALFVNGVAQSLLKLYFLFVPYHFCAQSFGIALIYCFKRGYSLSALERELLKRMFQATALYATLRQLAFQEWGKDTFLGMEVPFWGPIPAWTVDFAMYVVIGLALSLTLLFAKRFALKREVFPWPALMLTLTGVAIFMLGKSTTNMLWLFVPAFYHGSQYLVISGAYYLKEKGLPENMSTSQIASLLTRETAIKYMGLVVLGGCFIYLAVPRILHEMGFNQVIAVAAIFATINFHHFITDGAVWKLRDPRVRKLLLA